MEIDEKDGQVKKQKEIEGNNKKQNGDLWKQMDIEGQIKK